MDKKASPDVPAPKGPQEDGSFKNDTVVSASAVQVPTKSRMSAITAILTSGLALFSDGYNAQIIGYMNPVFAKLYPDSFSSSIKTRLSNAFLIGEVLGMLFFGYAIDRLGRRAGIVFATLFLVLGIILATAAHGKTELGMFWMMIVGRGVAGFGAGGEYPTCGTGSTEASDETSFVRRRRGLLVAAATDFSIDLGFVMAGVVALIVLAAYHQHVGDGVWRINFGIGFVLPVALLFLRLRQFDSTQYKKHAIKQDIPYLLVIKRYWKPMLGTSLAWFFYDFVTYPFGIFSSTIIATLNPKDTLQQNIGFGTVVNCFYLPGCVVGGILMDRIGRRQTMTLGFLGWTILGFIIGGALSPIQSVFPLFIVLYGIFNALGEMGPGNPFQRLCEDISWASRQPWGKAGAAIGTQAFTPIQDSFSDKQRGIQAVFLIGAAFAAVGGLVAWFLIPDKDKELESEDAQFRLYLEQNGYKGSFGEVMKD
ncbi:metabolite transport GIT1 [Fusarium pseudocircinatum]|uniref:Metabolite transport GIT1 n=1 Tax=Fusarium pseudocircinatum TaxID=56676 RepID=A0A8H5UYM9_9HYPO|nr:metabolite transport GIT1 [Fusarium pseudocircinatum]